MKDYSQQLANTDELPVLSEETIREPGRTTSAEDPNGLDAAVAKLAETLEHAEGRWQKLESQLQRQMDAIWELKRAIEQPGSEQYRDVAHSNLRFLPAGPAPTDEDITREDDDWPEIHVPARSEASRSERILRERIASLEAYVTARADYWRAMETEVAEKSRRIAELERKLGSKDKDG